MLVTGVCGSMKHFTTLCLLVLSVAMLIRESNARPPWLTPESKIFEKSTACNTDDELLDLCQRCAKLTKSKIALPACCSTDMEARKWCSDYVYFGREQTYFQ